MYMVSKNLSVSLSVHTFNNNYLRTGKTEWAKKIVKSMAKSLVSIFFLQKEAGRIGAEAKTATLSNYAIFTTYPICNKKYVFSKECIK